MQIVSIKAEILKLDAAGFQILCDELLSKKGYANRVSLGTAGEGTKTTFGTPDTYFSSGGKYALVEFTTQRSNLFSKIKSDLEKCLNTEHPDLVGCPVGEIIYCHTSSNLTPSRDKQLHDMCEQKGIPLTIMGLDQLAVDIMKYPSIIKRCLHLSIDTAQIEEIDEFIKAYDSNPLAAPLNTPFSFREKEMLLIDAAFEKSNVVILRGASGVGKTRLAIEYARHQSFDESTTTLCIHSKGISLFDDLKIQLETPGKYFLVIDDANQLAAEIVKLIVEYTNRQIDGYDVQILITVRDYAIEKIRSAISDISMHEEVEITTFSDDEIEALIKNTYDLSAPLLLERINTISEGNARVALYAGKIAKARGGLSTISDANEVYDKYFGKILSDPDVEITDQLLKATGIAAFLNVLHLDHIEPLFSFLEQNGLSYELFKNALYDLHAREIVDIYHDKAVRFSEQVFSNYMLKLVFCDRRLLSLADLIEATFYHYRGHVVFSISTLLNVFRNADILSYVTDEIKKVWDKLKTTNPNLFEDFLLSFCALNPTESLIHAKAIIDQSESICIPASEIDTEHGKNYVSVSDTVIALLGNLCSYSDIDTVIDLFFQYYLKRPDKYIEFYHAIKTFFGLNIVSLQDENRIQVALIKGFCKYSDNWKNDYIRLLFLDVAPYFLGFEFSFTEPGRNDRTVRFSRFILPQQDSVYDYRSMFWDALLQLSQDPINKSHILKMLHGYGKVSGSETSMIVEKEAPYVIALVEKTCSPDSLYDCSVVEHLSSIFVCAGLPSESRFGLYLDNNKLQLLARFRTKVSKGWHDNLSSVVIQVFEESSDCVALTKTLLAIAKEAEIYASLWDFYCRDQTFLIILDEIPWSKESFLELIQFALTDGCAKFLPAQNAVNKLLGFVSVEEAHNTIDSISDVITRNQWLYSFFCAIPYESIGAVAIDWLRAFLSDSSADGMDRASSRSVNFLEKFDRYCSGVYLEGVRSIFSKRTSAPFISRIYLANLIDTYDRPPLETIALFADAPQLLEEIYLWLCGIDQHIDYSGDFLVALLKCNSEFILTYTKTIMSLPHDYQHVCVLRLRSLVLTDDFIALLDSVFAAMVNSSPFPESRVPDLLKILLIGEQGNQDITEHADKWIHHAISKYASSDCESYIIFEATSEMDPTRRISFFKTFLEYNRDFDSFKKLPLFPISYGWSNSAVPLFQRWQSFLLSLSSILSGVDLLLHKNYIENKRKELSQQIVEEEISNIIRG